MKILLLSILLLALFSCSNSEEKLTENKPKNETIEKKENTSSFIKRWVLMEKSNVLGDKKIEYKNEPTDVILEIRDNGYFIQYDSLKDPKWIDRGAKQIETRNTGQWVYANNILTLTYYVGETEVVENLKIDKLNDDSLTTINTEKDILTYYSSK